MARYQIHRNLVLDDVIEDGYVLVAGSCLTLSAPTYRALEYSRTFVDVAAAVVQRGDGMHLIPLGLLDQGEAREVAAGLAFVTPEPSSVCIYPPCSQDAVATHPGGFRLCRRHFDILADWDDLVA